MRLLLLGTTGMVGRGVLREALLDPDVTQIVSIGRARTGVEDPKLVERVVPDLFDLTSVESDLTDVDACFFCLGVSAAGMSEEQYRHITHDLTLSVAKTLLRKSSKTTFVYVSGDGTNARSKTMWARVKGETENELLSLGFSRAFMFRPALIQPMHGIVSHTKAYRIFYAVFGWMLPLFRVLTPRYVTTSERVGRAMLVVAKKGAASPIVENRDINALALSDGA